MRLRHGTMLAVALGAALLAGGCGGAGGGKDELVIGEYGSLTGGDATFGQSTKLGVDVAFAELTANKQGKIGGLPVRFVVEDDQGKAEEAANAVQKEINQDRVVAVIGEVASSRSLAAAPICQANGVPVLRGELRWGYGEPRGLVPWRVPGGRPQAGGSLLHRERPRLRQEKAGQHHEPSLDRRVRLLVGRAGPDEGGKVGKTSFATVRTSPNPFGVRARTETAGALIASV